MKFSKENSITRTDSIFQKFLFKLFFLIIYLLILIKFNYAELSLFFDGSVYRSIYENYYIDWNIFDTKYQFLQGLGAPEFIFNLNLSLPFLTSFLINKLINFDLIFLYHFFSYFLLFGTSYLLFSKVSKEKKNYLFIIYFSFFFSSVSLINYNLKFSNIFTNVPHFIELSAYINLCIFFLIKSVNFNYGSFNLKNYIFFLTTFFYITCFANIYLLFYSVIFFFLILIITIISFKKKIINIKYFLILSLLLFLICLPNIIISLSNMLNSHTYFFSNEINNDRKLNFVSYLFYDSLICKIIYFLFALNIALNFKSLFEKNIIINSVSLIIIFQALFFSIIYSINPNLLKLSPIYSEYIFLTVFALQSFMILEKINYLKKYIILFLSIFCIALYSNIFLKFPDYLKISKQEKNSLVSKLEGELNNEKEFSGKFITYNNAISSEGYLSWSENVHSDIFKIHKNFKSDFRILASLHYQIPSLNFYNSFTTPVSYNLKKKLISDDIKNERSAIVFDIINYKILDLLGVKFIIDKNELEDQNINKIGSIKKNNLKINLYEIINFSPFKNPHNIIESENIEETNAILKSINFKPARDAIVNKIFINNFNLKFNKIDDFKFKIYNNSIFTYGNSENPSVIVLPYEFSNCFISKNKNKLFPVNGGLLGILYKDKIQDEIYFKQNFYKNFNCALKDFFHYKKIKN